MDEDIVTFVLYRKNSFYIDLDDFLNTFNTIEPDYIYNFTDEELVCPDVEIYKHSNNVENVIKHIYSDNLGENCLILDTCIHYPVNTDLSSLTSLSFCMISMKDYEIPIILSKVVKNEFQEVLFDFTNNPKEYSCIPVNIDESFFDNFEESSSIQFLLLCALFFNKEIGSVDEYKSTREKEKAYEYYAKYLLSEDKEDKVNYLKKALKYSYNRIFLSEFQKLEGAVPRDIIQNKNIEDLFILKGNICDEEIYNSIIETCTNRSLFSLSDLPDYVPFHTSPLILDYLPKLTLKYEELDTESVSISDKIEINLTGAFVYSDTNNLLDVSKGLISYRGKVLILKSLNPIEIAAITNISKTIITHDTNINYKHKIVSNVAVYAGYYIFLIQLANGCYQFVLLETKTLNLTGVSKHFTINVDGQIVGLVSEGKNLFLVSSNKLQLTKSLIEHKSLFIDILTKFNIKNPLSVIIKKKNTIYLTIDGKPYTAEDVMYNKYVFTAEPSAAYKIDYAPESKLLTIMDKIKYLKTFVYLEQDIELKEKTYTFYFHDSVKAEDICEQAKDLDVSIGDDYTKCKFYVVDQRVFEKMNSDTISDIIQNQLFIISLIDEESLKKKQLRTNYTSDEILTKLFLFNIVKNETYVQFIFDKIIHSNEYEKRSNFVKVDLENIQNTRNIHKIVLRELKNDSKLEFSLTNKEDKLVKSIRSKIINKISPEQYNNVLNIVQFIITKNFECKVGLLDINRVYMQEHNVFIDILSKLNFLGEIKYMCDGEGYDIYIIKTKSQMSEINSKDDMLIYIIEDELLIKI